MQVMTCVEGPMGLAGSPGGNCTFPKRGVFTWCRLKDDMLVTSCPADRSIAHAAEGQIIRA